MDSFIGRKDELAALEKIWNKPGLAAASIFGRRQVGKSSLIGKFVEDKPAIALTADDGSLEENILSLREALSDSRLFADIPEFTDFRTAFRFII